MSRRCLAACWLVLPFLVYLMAIFMANAGGSWDNAKKYIEGGAHGGKGSQMHIKQLLSVIRSVILLKIRPDRH